MWGENPLLSGEARRGYRAFLRDEETRARIDGALALPQGACRAGRPMAHRPGAGS
ncbi:hypothetical protein GCM10010343_22880 [Streptomyces avidinii]|uniref:Uncharacterized protein n=1 Tax=Streptomyces avidinii TaxID=1895 RepID=A0ABS4L5E0_STRAV|nr:hypothetical protein [Streptomyces avidinii]GGY96670.1 hypothetical protein GCM10010343_22880 [Streptomyces avidinii]